jgi:NAD(P)-dependent dehydrogenase (short-subunit alcohol dehydrogenase family)
VAAGYWPRWQIYGSLAAVSGDLFPVPFVEPIDDTHVVTFLAADKARYITGVTLPVDAGYAVT